jgi:hypothetical protein
MNRVLSLPRGGPQPRICLVQGIERLAQGCHPAFDGALNEPEFLGGDFPVMPPHRFAPARQNHSRISSIHAGAAKGMAKPGSRGTIEGIRAWTDLVRSNR